VSTAIKDVIDLSGTQQVAYLICQYKYRSGTLDRCACLDPCE